MSGPVTAYSDRLHAQKYRLPGENFRESVGRVASALADNDRHFHQFRDILMDMRFLPAGRVQCAIGAPRVTTPYNCFVSGTIHDSFVHGDNNNENSIMDIAKQAATTMRMGGGIGYDWSTLRPSDDIIKGVLSKTDGPLAFMPINDAVCGATSSAGNRRGAQMGVLRIDHPDIEKFIRVKQPSQKMEALWELVSELPEDHPRRGMLAEALQETLRLTGFNLSIAVTDEFMECLAAERPFPLRFQGRVYREVDPVALWEMVMRSTWDWAEPGVLFIDTINRMNNLSYCETIAATNPCGEQPLPPYGACLLGSFNLVKYLTGTKGNYGFDWHQLQEDIRPVTRAMDNVVDVATYPLPQQEREARSKRRMGLGITGLANAAEALGKPYGSSDFLGFERLVLSIIRDTSYQASMELAIEKGAFEMFDSDRYCEGEFIKSLPQEIQADIRRHGIRNSHLTSLAPTGTISMSADNISSSSEPVFMYESVRKVNMMEGEELVDVKDYGVAFLGVRGRLADEVTAEEHISVLTTAQEFVDSSVSKTCNVSSAMPWESFKGLYRSAYDGGAKGCTTFNPGGRRLGIFMAKKAQEVREDEPTATADMAVGQSCQIDFASGRRSCE